MQTHRIGTYAKQTKYTCDDFWSKMHEIKIWSLYELDKKCMVWNDLNWNVCDEK